MYWLHFSRLSPLYKTKYIGFRISERRAAERREQYKLVREHVKRDDSGRIEVTNWWCCALFGDAFSSSYPTIIAAICVEKR